MNHEVESGTLTVPEAARRLGIGRTLAFELVQTNQFPVRVLRLGRRVLVPRVALERVLAGADPEADRLSGATESAA